MVTLGLALALQGARPNFELVAAVLPGAVTVEALVALPPGGPLERAEEAVMARALLEDTGDYNRHQLLRLTSPTGDPIHCEILPDALHIRFSVTDADAGTAISILSNVVRTSVLKDEDLKAAKEGLQFRQRDYWSLALNPEILPLSRVQFEDIHNLYRWMARPENLYVTIAADPSLTEKLGDKWAAETANWMNDDVRLFPADKTSPKPAVERKGKLTTIVLRGQPVNPGASTIYANLLATFALGGGKSSAVWKSLREGLGWSYRQEALLRNSVKGLEPVIEVVTAGSDADVDRANSVGPALLKAVAAWTEADRKRALGAAQAQVDRGLGLDPLYFKGTSPSYGDTLFMQNYWRMKTGFDWDSAKVLELMNNVDLEAMRNAAKTMLEGSSVEIIRGSG